MEGENERGKYEVKGDKKKCEKDRTEGRWKVKIEKRDVEGPRRE